MGGVVTLPNETHMRRMFYVGMSRARAVLVIVAQRELPGTLGTAKGAVRRDKCLTFNEPLLLALKVLQVLINLC